MAIINISAEFAQQIVNSTKAIVGKDVNYINLSGIIIASTNPKRVGEFHEIGYQVIKNSESAVVNEDAIYKGTRKGINYPIFVEGKVVGVIGITGDPEEVSQYGFLLTKISEIFIKEYLLELGSINDRQRTNKLLLSLLYHDTEDVTELAKENEFDLTQRHAVIQILINKRCNQSNLNMIEKEVIGEIKANKIGLFTYIYPNEIVCLIDQKQYSKLNQKFEAYEKKYQSILNIGIGTPEDIDAIHISYHFAKIATKHSLENERVFTLAENMNLELLIASLEQKIKDQYCKKILGKLCEEDIELLKIYFRNELSLKQTAEDLFIHKNTLQYRLNHIKEKSGFDPRTFKEAVVLYLAIRTYCYV